MLCSKEEHNQEHDSSYDPKPNCSYCRYEVFRKTHRCFGDGSSNTANEGRKEQE